jgi:nucleoside-diphosphate-sugar epimerase
MKILVAGATGALGKQLVPRLVAAGHQLVGMTRSESKRDELRANARDAGRRRRA